MSERTFIHPTATVDASATLGAGTAVWAFTRIAQAATIGAGCRFGQNVYVDRGVHIGNRVKVQNNVSIYTGVDIDDGVFLGPSCVFTNVEFPRAFIERKSEFRPTRVGRGVTIGANATVVCGVHLGEFSLIGAGAVVVTDVRAFSLVVGNPARRIGWVSGCGERLTALGAVQCARCMVRYDVTADSCEVADPEAFESWWQGRMMGMPEYAPPSGRVVS
jgi:UDP-2-acetamido-3-amino-2,3-dideoxy-glucuronate N-acetyltransferase